MKGDADLVVSSAPHLRDRQTVGLAMRDVFVALMPVTAVSIYYFHWNALFLISVCLLTAVLTEVLFRRMMKKEPTLYDWSAVLTGLFVAMLFPATTPWWKAALAVFIGVGFAKELAGGLGRNRFNPALFGLVALMLLAPLVALLDEQFASLYVSFGTVDVLTQATPLAMLHQGMEMPSYGRLLTAFPGGALGETSPLFLLIGAAYLFFRGHLNWRIPASILITVAALTTALGQNPIQHLLVGSLPLGAFFMATDWVTSPFTNKGKYVFGICIGIGVVMFRLGLSPTEGVAYSILIMNGFVPMIERWTLRPQFGRHSRSAVSAAER